MSLVTVPHLIRVLRLKKPPLVGGDVEAVRRGGIRFLHDDKLWGAYQDMNQAAAQTFGGGMANLVKRVQAGGHLMIDGVAGPAVDHLLRSHGAYDSVCDALLDEYADNHPAVTEWYPQMNGPHEYVCQGFHPTEGLPGNWAIDFCAPGGTPVVASFAGRIERLSGHDPATGTHGRYRDIFGWSTYIRRADGVLAYLTHQGSRAVAEGQTVAAGQVIGSVGHWPGNPGRSHTHLGITSPKGATDAKRIIRAISLAPKVPRV